MEKPVCRLCGKAHWSHEPHAFASKSVEKRVESKVADKTKVQVERMLAERERDTKVCPQCKGTGRVATSKAAYMREYRKRKA